MHIKCQASDMLSMMPVIALYCHLALMPICPKACRSFLALADVVEFLWAAGRSTLEAPALDALVEKFLALYVDEFGWEWLTPKFHWLLHFGDQYVKRQMLPNCFVLERRQRIPQKDTLRICVTYPEQPLNH